MPTFHIIWKDKVTDDEHMSTITASSFEDACKCIGVSPENAREDDLGVSWETYEIDNSR